MHDPLCPLESCQRRGLPSRPYRRGHRHHLVSVSRWIAAIPYPRREGISLRSYWPTHHAPFLVSRPNLWERSRPNARRRKMRAPLGATYLPNRMNRPLEIFEEKMYCGRFSTSGDVLLTAGQDARINLYEAERVYQWSAKEPGVLGRHVRKSRFGKQFARGVDGTITTLSKRAWSHLLGGHGVVSNAASLGMGVMLFYMQ